MNIAVVSGGSTWGSVNPEALLKGLGGREGAAVFLSECWSSMGHEVHVFANQEEGPSHRVKPGGGRSSYVPIDMAIPMLANFPYDFILSWEDPTIFSVPEVQEQGSLALCGMQVAHLPHVDPDHYDNVDCWVALSPWAAEFLQTQSDRLKDMKIQPNCVLIDNYEERTHGEVRSEGKHFLYASSPDRGLVHLLRAWPKFREAFPFCQLHICYGLEHMINNKWLHNLVGEMALDIERLVEQDGVIVHGKIGQTQLSALHSTCDALLFPCDPIGPTETGCITVIEALATGNIPFITDADCLPSEFGDQGAVVIPLPWDADKYIAEVKDILDRPVMVKHLRKKGRAFAESRDWRITAKSWLTMVDYLKDENLALFGNEQ